jgi:hypothetical protein
LTSTSCWTSCLEATSGTAYTIFPVLYGWAVEQCTPEIIDETFEYLRNAGKELGTIEAGLWRRSPLAHVGRQGDHVAEIVPTYVPVENVE